jgi:uncharacterized membrane protein YgcG
VIVSLVAIAILVFVLILILRAWSDCRRIRRVKTIAESQRQWPSHTVVPVRGYSYLRQPRSIGHPPSAGRRVDPVQTPENDEVTRVLNSIVAADLMQSFESPSGSVVDTPSADFTAGGDSGGAGASGGW